MAGARFAVRGGAIWGAGMFTGCRLGASLTRIVLCVPGSLKGLIAGNRHGEW